MKTIVCLLVAISSVCYGCNNTVTANHDAKDSAYYVAASLAFIKSIKTKELNDSSFILSDQPFSFVFFDCLADVMADTIAFSRKEREMIRQKKYPAVSRWDSNMFSQIRFVSRDTLNAIFKNGGVGGGWDSFYKKIGNSFHSFSMPIFLRNYTYCLFYDDTSCGGLCGYGHLVLYKKENGKWVETKSYCDWIS